MVVVEVVELVLQVQMVDQVVVVDQHILLGLSLVEVVILLQ